MKITTIYHPDEETKKDRKKDLLRTRLSKNPLHHPFMQEREIIRTINSIKLERLFSKPFIKALSYHKEGIIKMTGHPIKDAILTLSFDSNIVLTDLDTKQKLISFDFNQRVCAIGIDLVDNIYVGYNKSIKRLNDDVIFSIESPINDLYVNDDIYVSSYKSLDLYDLEKGINKMKVDIEKCNIIETNQIFRNLVACSSKNTNYIIDIRYKKSVMEFNLPDRINKISYNPVDAHYLSTACEDTNGYIHDMRFINNPCNILRGHVSPLTSIKYNPSGKEICTGSYDKTLRIFRSHERKSRDVYYNNRMQHISGVEYSKDGSYIISSSDDGSIRMWKSEASIRSGLSKREKDMQKYSKVLIDKYKDVAEVDRINKHRFLPRLLKSTMKQKNEHHQAEVRKGRQ